MDEETEKIIKEIFDKYDKNKNGTLEREEFCKGFLELVKSLGEGLDDKETQKITDEAITKFDLNRNGTIEINEFTELMIFLINEKGLSLEDVSD